MKKIFYIILITFICFIGIDNVYASELLQYNVIGKLNNNIIYVDDQYDEMTQTSSSRLISEGSQPFINVSLEWYGNYAVSRNFLLTVTYCTTGNPVAGMTPGTDTNNMSIIKKFSSNGIKQGTCKVAGWLGDLYIDRYAFATTAGQPGFNYTGWGGILSFGSYFKFENIYLQDYTTELALQLDELEKSSQMINNQISTNYKLDESINQQKETNSKLNDLNNSQKDTNNTLNDDNVDESTSEATEFFEGFDTDTHGLTSIITAPLELIGNIAGSTCSPLPLQVPFVNKTMSLPCMSTIYKKHFGSFLTVYQTITFGIVAYWVCVRIFALVKDFKNPEHDEIEVMDL